MKFKINRDHFSAGLQQVLNVVSSRLSMSILSNVLIRAEGDFIELTTTNFDLGTRCYVKAEVLEAGGVTLPAKKLASLVRSLPSLEVSFESTPNQAKINSGGSSYRIMGMPQEEFPPLPSFTDQQEFVITQEDLAQMLKSVSYAQSTDENRSTLNGIFFGFGEEKLTLVATDGRRLGIMSRVLPLNMAGQNKFILPAKTCAELERVLGQGDSVKVSFNSRQVSFDIQVNNEKAQMNGLINQIYLISKIVEGNYPNYEQVIPKETAQRIKIERELFLDSLQRAAIVTSEKSNSVRLKIRENVMDITCESPEYGQAHESMAIAYDGPNVEVSFNPHFLMDPLRAVTKDEVFFEFKDELSPGVFKTKDTFMCVVMPLRLED